MFDFSKTEMPNVNYLIRGDLKKMGFNYVKETHEVICYITYYTLYIMLYSL